MKVLLALLVTYGTASAQPCKAQITKGDFGLGYDDQWMTLYRLATCEKLAVFRLDGPLESATIRPTRDLPTIVIDTWLMHGDRKRQTFVAKSGHYVMQREETLLGPRKKP